MSIKNTFQNSLREKGFILPDVLFAVFITASALVSMLAVLAPSFRAEFFKRDQIIATGLAQEGIELVRNMRDSNWIAGRNAFDAPFPSDGSLCGDYTALFQCGGSTDLYNNAGVYKASVQGNPVFTRSIVVSSSGNTRQVTSTVTWNGHDVVLQSTLYAWGDK